MKFLKRTYGMLIHCSYPNRCLNLRLGACCLYSPGFRQGSHSRKLAYTRSALLSPPGALGYRVRDHPGYLGRSLAAGVAIKRYELLRLATRELRENFLHIASGAMVLGRFRSSTDKEVCPRGVQRAVTGVLCLLANRSRRGKAWDCCYTPGRRER